MANPYYDAILGNYVRNTKALAEDVSSDYNAIIKGFDGVASDIASIQSGSPPGFGQALDLRQIMGATVSFNAFLGSPTPPPQPSDTIPAGLGYVMFCTNGGNTNHNDGVSTLNIGSSEGAVPIKKSLGGVWVDLDPGDIVQLYPQWIFYSQAQNVWLLEIPQSHHEEQYGNDLLAESNEPSAYFDANQSMHAGVFAAVNDVTWMRPIFLYGHSDVKYRCKLIGTCRNVTSGTTIQFDLRGFYGQVDYASVISPNVTLSSAVVTLDTTANKKNEIVIDIPANPAANSIELFSCAFRRTGGDFDGEFCLQELVVREWGD